jgi:hypothetical protein
MTISELKTIVANRLSTLGQQRGHAAAVGDVARVAALDAEITETELTLAQLGTL